MDEVVEDVPRSLLHLDFVELSIRALVPETTFDIDILSTS